MADPLPRSSTTVHTFAVIAGTNLLDILGNGSLTTDTASRKRRKIGVKYHSEDIEKCFFKVRRLSANPTLTDMERSLNEYQGTPRKKKFGELEDEIMRQQDARRREREEFLHHANERLRCMQVEMDRLRTEKDDEIRRKNDEISRKSDEISRKNEVISRKNEVISRNAADSSTMNEIIKSNHEELLVKDQEIKEKDELIRRKDKELRQLRLI